MGVLVASRPSRPQPQGVGRRSRSGPALPSPAPGPRRLTAAGQRPAPVLRVRLGPPGARRHLAVEGRLLRAARPRARPCPGARGGRALLHHSVRVGHGEARRPGYRDAPAGGEEVKRRRRGWGGRGAARSACKPPASFPPEAARSYGARRSRW